MKRRLSKRGIIVIASAVLVLLLGGLTAHLVFSRPTVSFNSDLVYDCGQPLKVSELVSEVHNGKLVNGEESVNTSVLGESTVKVVVSNRLGREYQYECTISVNDKEAPVIELPERIEMILGESVDLLSYGKATDNSGQYTLTLQEGYDLNKVGLQYLNYQAVDGAGNRTEKQTVLLIRENADDKKEYFLTSKGFTGYQENERTYIEGLLIVNKTYGLPANYGPRGLTSETAAAFQAMAKAAKASGYELTILSAYRNYSFQEKVYSYNVEKLGEQKAQMQSAKPGHSEHQAGIALDLNSTRAAFADTDTFKWLNENAYKYGFILRYPQGKSEFTGYDFLPFQFTYVGEDWAKVFYNEGNWLAVEEYFGITSRYGD